MGALLVGVLRFGLRIFFRRVETFGVERVPRNGPLLFVLNHPNSLVDPVFILGLAPRPVSLLAKAPLFRMPVIGRLVRALGSIPVERRQDPGADLAKNREMFARVRAHLEAGGAVALFPEGTSHSDPRLKPLKTGAARIALGVVSIPPLRIQPVGLFYTLKHTFRSAALVYFGEPFVVSPAPLDGSGEPPRERVQPLTAEIGRALAAVTLQADESEAHDFVARTERILASERRESDDAPRPELTDEFGFRRRILAGYHALRERDPERLERMRRRILRYEDRLRGAGVDPWDLPVGRFRASRGVGRIALFLLRSALFLPLGLPGLVLHYLPYQAVGFLSSRAAGTYQDLLATAKALAAAIVFPLTWIIATLLAWRLAGPVAGGVTLLLAPPSGYAALRLMERADRTLGALRALALWLGGRRRFMHLQVERRVLREDVLKLAAELGV
ncbi:MAG TPA: lysophospholipid acyltransferase family protein [Gemmatimonadales bacterium]|nr:lysophospholipid acyltransferase family protein [Gemmatimonadales bacterium]